MKNSSLTPSKRTHVRIRVRHKNLGFDSKQAKENSKEENVIKSSGQTLYKHSNFMGTSSKSNQIKNNPNQDNTTMGFPKLGIDTGSELGIGTGFHSKIGTGS